MSNKAVCLFSSAGIGELGIVENEIDIIVSNELLEDRHKIHAANYPTTTHIQGDIWKEKEKIIQTSKELLNGEELFLLYATPPCQGMSSNGAGKLLSEVKKGNRKKLDDRNQLIIPTLDIILQLQPKWVIFENVENMKNTIIEDENKQYVNIMEYIESKLSKSYIGNAEVVNCADFSIPQARKRLITIYTRIGEGKSYFREHKKFFLDADKITSDKPITLKHAIGHLPPLDAVEGKNERLDIHPYYFVPVMPKERYFWVSNTPPGESAFHNQCINPNCGYQFNKRHGSNTRDGVHSSNKDTPLYCSNCGELLPRPSVKDKISGELRLIKGYDTTYARMEWDKPSATLTQNFQYDSSGRHYHPSQNRILSIYEGLILQTITDYNFNFEVDGKLINRTIMAEIIGESVPPKLIDLICNKIIKISTKKYLSAKNSKEKLNQLEFSL